jgi:hypothetical protein
MSARHRPLLPNKIEFIRDNHVTMRVVNIARHLTRGYPTIYTYLVQNGLKPKQTRKDKPVSVESEYFNVDVDQWETGGDLRYYKL